MGRQLKGLLYFYVTDIRHAFIIFWSILLSTLIVSIVGGYLLLKTGNNEMVFGLSIALYIYCSICGFITVKQGIPFAIKMGATRKNIFISMGIFFLGLAFVKAVLANTLHSAIMIGTEKLGIDTFRLLHPAELLSNTWLTRVIIDTAVMFFLLALMYCIGLLFYNYGLVGGGSAVGAVVIFLLLGLAQGFITDFIVDVYQTLTITFFCEILFVGVGIYLITWLMTRRITIK